MNLVRALRREAAGSEEINNRPVGHKVPKKINIQALTWSLKFLTAGLSFPFFLRRKSLLTPTVRSPRR